MVDQVNFDDPELLDDFDFDPFDFDNPDTLDPESRDPVLDISANALDHFRQGENLARMGGRLVKNMLPEGFRYATDVGDEAVKEVKSLYDSATEELSKPIKDLREGLADNVGLLGFLSEENQDKLSDWLRPEKTEDTESTEKDKEDPNAALISAALSSLSMGNLKTNRVVQEFNGMMEMEKLKAEGAANNIQSRLLAEIVTNTSRDVAFNEQVSIDSIRKSLELQFKQYFVAVETRDALIAMAEDTATNLKALNHNTALPDWQKSHLSENYSEHAMANLFGTASESISNWTSGFTSKLKNKAKDKLSNILSTVKSSVKDVTSLVGELGGAAGGMDEETRNVVIGDLIGEALGNYFSDSAGSALGRLGADNEKIKEMSDRLMFFAENAPSEINDIADQYRHIPFIGDLLEMVDGFKGNDVEMVQSLAEKGTDVVPLDLYMRKSIVEIIPGYLSRILEQVSIANGDTSGRMTYSVDKEAFVSLADEAKEKKDQLFKRVSEDRAYQITELLAKMDKEDTLSSGAKRELGKIMLDNAQKGRTFNIDQFAYEASETANADELIPFLKDLEEKSNFADKRNFADSYRESAKSNTAMQEEVNKLVASGQTELLTQAGLTSIKDGKTVFDNEAYLTEAGKYIGDFKSMESAKQRIQWEEEAEDRKKNEMGALEKLIYNSVEKVSGKVRDRIDRAAKKAKGESDSTDDAGTPEEPSTTAKAEQAAGKPKSSFKEKVREKATDVGTHITEVKDAAIQNLTGSTSKAKDVLGEKYQSAKETAEGYLPNTETLAADVKEKVDVLIEQLKDLGRFNEVEGLEKLDFTNLNQLSQLGERIKDLNLKLTTRDVSENQLNEELEEITQISEEQDNVNNTNRRDDIFPSGPSTSDSRSSSDSVLPDIAETRNILQTDAPSREADQGDRGRDSQRGADTRLNTDWFSEFRDFFFDEEEGVYRLPVSIAEPSPSDAPDNSGFQSQLLELISGGFQVNAGMLEQIVANTAPADETGKKGFIGSMSDKFGGILKGAGSFSLSYLKGMGALSSGLGKGIGAVISKTIGATSSGLAKFSPFGSKDLYLKGQPDEPALFAWKMKKGHYIDDETGKVIKKVKDVHGNIRDIITDTIVVSKQDLEERGLYTRTGTAIEGFTNLITAPISITKDLLNLNFKALGKIGGLAKKLLPGKKAFDVYVGGNENPHLLKMIFDNGGYYSRATKKPLSTPHDIDGEVIDASGTIVLSHEDIKKGLYDINGNRVGSSKLLSFTKKLLLGTAKVFGKTVKAVWDQGVAATYALGNIGLGAGKALGGLLGYGKGKTIDSEPLMAINDYLQKRWPLDGSEPVTSADERKIALLERIVKNTTPEGEPEMPAWDTDGDGLRDGSWQAQMKEKEAEALRNSGDAEEKKVEKEQEKGNGLLTIIAGILTAGFGSLVGTIKDFMMGKMLKDGAGSIIDGLNPDMPDRDGNRGNRNSRGRAPRGKMGRAWQAVKGFFGAGTKTAGAELAVDMATRQAGKTVAKKTALKVAGGVLAKTALAAGGTAAAILGAPIVATGIAIGGMAWTAYEIGSFVASRLDAEDLERLRFMQYGINVSSGSELGLIRELESEVLDLVTWKGDVPSVRLSIAEAIDKLGSIYGVDESSSQSDINSFIRWFQFRFLPVFLKHLGAVYKLDKSVDLTDIDDELEDKHKPLFLHTVADGKYENANPMAIGEGPFPGTEVAYGNDEIAQYIESLKQQYPMSDVTEAVDPMAEVPLATPKKQEVKTPDTAAPKSVFNLKGPTRLSPHLQTKPVTKQYTASQENVAAAVKQQMDKEGIQYQGKQKPKGNYFMPVEGRFSSPFGARIHPISGVPTGHKGIDKAAPEGTPIHAAEDGVVWRRYRSKSYGNVVYLNHYDGNQTRYAHMHNWVHDLKEGDEVKRGEIIGFVGNTGASAGNHLHFEVRDDHTQYGKPLDPMDYLGTKAKQELSKAEKDAKQETTDVDEPVNPEDTIEGFDTLANKRQDTNLVPPQPEIPPTLLRRSPTPDVEEEKRNLASPVPKVPEQRTTDPLASLGTQLTELARTSLKQSVDKKSISDLLTTNRNSETTLTEILSVLKVIADSGTIAPTTNRQSTPESKATDNRQDAKLTPPVSLRG